MVDFIYSDNDSTVLLVARTQRAKDKVRKDMVVTQRFGPAIVLNPQEALVVRYTLRREGYTVQTV